MSLRRSRSVALVTALLLLAGGFFSCSAQHDRNEQREMEAIERKIVPLDAQVLARSGPVQSKWSITATWDIETRMDRVEYSKWITAQLVPEFKIVRADESQLTFSKHTDGDTRMQARFDQCKTAYPCHLQCFPGLALAPSVVSCSARRSQKRFDFVSLIFQYMNI